MYVLLEYFSLQELLEACEMKYPKNSIVMTRNALVHFDDIDFTVPIDYIGTSIKWTEISNRLKAAFKNPQKKFSRMSDLTLKLIKAEKNKKPKRNRGRKF